MTSGPPAAAAKVRPAAAELRAALMRWSVREGDFTLASGRRSGWYVDSRQVTFRGECVGIVGRAVLEAVGGLAFDAVGGLTLGADPVALAVAAATGGRAFAVRKERKGHGAGGRIAGPLQPGDDVLVVDDAVTSGASTLAAIEAITAFGGRVVAAACLLDRGGALGESLAALGVPFYPVLSAPDLGFPLGS